MTYRIYKKTNSLNHKEYIIKIKKQFLNIVYWKYLKEYFPSWEGTYSEVFTCSALEAAKQKCKSHYNKNVNEYKKKQFTIEIVEELNFPKIK